MPMFAASNPPRPLVGRTDECAALDRLLADAYRGTSRAVVLHGEAGAGKSALLAYVASRAAGWRVVSAAGVESEVELAFSGLHQLCAPMLDRLDRLPAPQRAALETVFGLDAGPPPDRFVVALATLTLLTEAADQQPLLCLVDDGQWLDEASTQIVGFVARRLLVERIAIVCAARSDPAGRLLAGLPDLRVPGLGTSDARALLMATVRGPLDAAVRDQIVAESHGNPLALLELPRTWDAGELAGGFGFPAGQPVAGRIEQRYSRRLSALPADTRLLLLVAAADSLGSPRLLERAAETLGVGLGAIEPAVDDGLVAVGRRVEFAHPLVRSAVYGAAAASDRQRVHLALADATDAERDPDRRAWHRACGTPGVDEDVAAELERSAGRAQARAGLAAAAAFLRKAAALSPDPARRATRTLNAAQASLHAGALETALELTAGAEAGAPEALQRARIGLVRGHLAFASGRGGDAAAMLLGAARGLEAFDPELARDAYLGAWGAALFAGRPAAAGNLREVSRAAHAAPCSGPPRPSDRLLDGLATLITDGRAAAAPALREAAKAFAGGDGGDDGLRWGWLATVPSSLLWDEAGWDAIGRRQLRRAREAGAMARLPIDLTTLGVLLAWRGEFAGAASAAAEAAAVARTAGVPLAPDAAMLVAALRGREDEARPLVHAAVMRASAGGQGIGVQYARWTAAILANGLARYDEALAAARDASDDEFDLAVASRALPELVEAAAKTGDVESGRTALERLAAATTAAGGDWALGLEARCRALLSMGESADELYREAIGRLGRTGIRTELARTHLVYGEWLRREGRRIDARRHLGAAHELLAGMGMEGFAERTRRELVATGERVRRRLPETRDDLTPQEQQIARLAAEGLSNPEIGSRLFISARTVEWHLRKVFAKLGISSRKQLRTALPVEAGLLPAHGA